MALASQRLAADPEASVFVRANAGSGKTKVLVDRIARLLLDGFEPSAFLCITYTKAAAAEMQRRLFERLGEWCVARDDKLTEELTKLRDAPPREGELARARTLFARALETSGGLRIQTIHAFCERLLARFPLEAGVAPGFEIADDARTKGLLAAAWASAATQAEDAARHFAARLDADRLEAFRKTLTSQRETITHMFGDGPIPEEAIRRRHGAPADRDGLIADALSRTPWDRYADIAAMMGDFAVADSMRTALATAGDARFEPWLDIFLTQTRTPVKRLVKADQAKRDPAMADFMLREQARALAAFEAARAFDRAQDAIEASRLARAIVHAYEAEKARSGVLDFDDLIAASRRLLEASNASAWVLYKLDGGIDHVLVDEGQDTSPGQWALLAPLIGEFFAGETRRQARRAVFAVGDPKQSIYSFQGADPARFEDESRRLASLAAAAQRRFVAPDLKMSFRSTQEVLDAVDAVFRTTPMGGSQPAASDLVQHLAFREEHRGCVDLWPLAPAPALPELRPWDAPLDQEPAQSSVAILATGLARAVKEMIASGEAIWDGGAKRMRRMEAGDVLVLVRSRGAVFRQMAKAFKAVGLPVAGADRMVLADEPAVQDVLALLRTALDPHDDLSLCVLLKSPFVGLLDDDADIFPLAHGRAPGESVFERLMLRSDERTAFARRFVTDILARASGPPYELLAAALERPGPDGRSGWRRMVERLGPEARDPLEEVLARALTCSRNGPATILHLLAGIEADENPVKREMEGAGAAVRIMTVHGAKGLEAPVVILPDVCGGPETGPKDILFFDDLAPIVSQRREGDDAIAAAARQGAADRASAEHKRLLYVALTRARDRLIVAGHRSNRGASDAHAESWYAMVEAGLREAGATTLATPFGEGLRLGAPQFAAEEAGVPIAKAARPIWLDRPAPEELARARPQAPSRLGHSVARSVQADKERRFRRGLLIHGLLERLPDVEPARREELARRWLLPQGAEGAAADALIAEALAVIWHPDFAAAFGPDSRAEAPIIGRGPGLPRGGVRGSIDRLCISRDEILIVDFKTDRPAPADPADAPDGYVMQLAAYRAVLSRAYLDRPVRCALIWTETPRLVEIPTRLLDAAATGWT
jgi:ATP-dependent helicase/nuclease subunit A